MHTGETLRRWLWLGGISCATALWALLFYANYWNASVTAFGDISTQLAGLKLVFWKYMAAGLGLAGGWIVTLRGLRQNQPRIEKQGVSSQGN